MWSLACVDNAGKTRAFVPFRGLTVRRDLNGGNVLQGRADQLADAMSELDVGSRALKLYDLDAAALRFHGKIDDPLEDDEDDVAFVAKDFGWLDQRRVQPDPAARTFAARDAGLIASDLLAAQNARGPTRLRMGAVQASQPRDRTYDPGKVVSEAIAELAKVDDGVYFVTNPVDGAAGTHAEIVVRYPASGTDRPGARFEFGDGTLANLAAFKRTRLRPLNFVTTTGANMGEGAALYSQRSDAASIAAYDLVEDEVAYATVTEQATLDQHAADALEPAPKNVYSFAAAPSSAQPGEPYVPRLWRDFDVGDVCRLTILHGRVSCKNVPVRVTSATVAIADDADAEQLASIVFEEA